MTLEEVMFFLYFPLLSDESRDAETLAYGMFLFSSWGYDPGRWVELDFDEAERYVSECLRYFYLLH
jgi:hypothetical protein